MERELTVVEHFEELRRRIILSLSLVVFVSIFAFPFASRIIVVLKAPSAGLIGRLVFFNVPEAFLIHIRIAFFTGLVLCLPVLLYQLWAFVSPAIVQKTGKQGLFFLFSSLGVFICGASFGFFVLLPASIKFLLSFSKESLEPVISASGYISFALGLILACGLVFEMPVLSYLLSKIGIVNSGLLRRAWKYAVVIIFIVAAIVTPTPDIFNMTLVAIPMLFLYELSIWVSKISGPRRGGDYHGKDFNY